MKKACKAYNKFRRTFPEIYAFVAVVIGCLLMCFGWLFVMAGCISNPLAVLLLVGGFMCVSVGADAAEER